MKETVLDKTAICEILHRATALVYFTKKDGSIRKMKCTLMESLLPAPQPVTTLPPVPTANERVVVENPNLVKAYDLENQGWRSFNVDRVISIVI
jgi:hypothetical protein